MQVEIRAVEAFADLLFAVDSDDPAGVFYNHLCEAACRLADMHRALVFLYDPGERRVRIAGSYAIDIQQFRTFHVDLDRAPMALQALKEDRVLEATAGFAELLPREFEHLLVGTRLVCTPIAAAGHWPGVLLSDRPVDRPLSEQERHLLWSFGKIAALAASARRATREQERARMLQERIDLARELHDGVVQRLFGVSLALSGDDLSAAQRRRCADEIRAALADLRTAVQGTLGRPSRETTTTLRDEVGALGRRLPGVAVALDAPAGVEVPTHLEPLAQSILAEAVRNARKHAAPKRIDVRVERSDGAFVLAVCNDGVRDAAAGPAGMGLRLAAVEALQHGGVVEFGPASAQTWEVRLLVPLEARR